MTLIVAAGMGVAAAPAGTRTTVIRAVAPVTRYGARRGWVTSVGVAARGSRRQILSDARAAGVS